jgi:hypothetical protein
MKALLVLLALGCGGQQAASSGGSGSGKPPIAAERASCTTADDCTLVEACCGCNAGGRRVAIRKDAVAEYDATRPQRCGDSVCTTVISNHSSCLAEAGCEAGACVVLAHQ